MTTFTKRVAKSVIIIGLIAAFSALQAAEVKVSVSLDPSLANTPQEKIVYIFARDAVNKNKPPLAVHRCRVEDLPLVITLDDSKAMAPNFTLSSASKVTITARVSISGNAIAEPGDLEGMSDTIDLVASGNAININIDKTVKP